MQESGRAIGTPSSVSCVRIDSTTANHQEFRGGLMIGDEPGSGVLAGRARPRRADAVFKNRVRPSPSALSRRKAFSSAVLRS